MPAESTVVYRVDRFIVPATARGEFLQRVVETHEILRAQEGFIRDAILEKASGPGRFNLVTIAEWRSQTDMDRAKSAVLAMQAKSGFNPQEILARLGIGADIANYAPVDP